ncbi:hypothetical protein [Brachybacterium sp. YJGR34]|uniref:hypothetical protein n=1 Tax=Brachybacterium sp. YJGR34 TaxID=2059911 RepID=UPI000E0AF179|nr:hypothetical protein [Brachybacterium sp. YJGR34]
MNTDVDRTIGEDTPDLKDYISVVLLAVTAVLTAWSGFESSKWGGEMSIAFSNASSARVEASRHETRAESARNFDLQIFGSYIEAVSTGDAEREEFVQTRFTDHFAVAFEAWIATEPLENPEAPRSPFVMEEYVPPGTAEAAEADARADQRYQDALDYNQRGDNYTLLTVLFALVLFFSAISQKLRSARLSYGVLALAAVFLVIGVVLLISYPKII